MEPKQERNTFLRALPDSLEHLTCDIILEAYLLEMRTKLNILPNLKTINKVPIKIEDLGAITLEKKILE